MNISFGGLVGIGSAANIVRVKMRISFGGSNGIGGATNTLGDKNDS